MYVTTPTGSHFVFKWLRKSREPKQAKESLYGFSVNSLKKCPSCNTEYNDTKYRICPDDGTLLLGIVVPEAQRDWFTIVKEADTKHCPTCSATYEPTEITCPLDGAELKCSGQDEVLIPVVAGRYRLLSFVGRNKLFETYIARDLQASAPDSDVVSVKYLHHQLKHDEKTVSRFLTLAKTAIGLEHSNLIRVHEVNVTEDGSPYMVSDHTDARSLEYELKKHSVMAETDTIKVFIDILEALVFAHERGIVHGGISTANLFVKKEDEQRPRGLLANIGVAERLLRQLEWEGQSTETRTSNVYGDPSGVCPEFCHGARSTTESDVYQIASALYEALCGKRPFERQNLTLVLLAHMNDEPDDIRKYSPETSEELWQLLEQCLRKEPSERPSAADLVAKLKLL